MPGIIMKYQVDSFPKRYEHNIKLKVAVCKWIGV